MDTTAPQGDLIVVWNTTIVFVLNLIVNMLHSPSCHDLCLLHVCNTDNCSCWKFFFCLLQL